MSVRVLVAEDDPGLRSVLGPGLRRGGHVVDIVADGAAALGNFDPDKRRTMKLPDLLAAACPPIGRLGAAFYFVPETLAKGKELGLDGFRFYFLGRGGVLGDVEAPVVGSAFGYFEPTVMARMWDSSRQVMAPRDAARAYLACAHDMGRRLLGDVGDLAPFCQEAEKVANAAEVAALTLFAGLVAEPLPDDPPARAMQLLAVLRELRGSAHLVAVRAVGLPPQIAHYLRRPGDYALFGWRGDPPEVTDEDRRLLAEADAGTDRLVGPAYAALDDAGQHALLGGLARIAPPIDAATVAPAAG
ncbi:MAG: SCO6745 family protein [Acidimicrobiales bacterium]